MITELVCQNSLGLDQDAFFRAGQCVHDPLGAARSHPVLGDEADSNFGSENVKWAKDQQTGEEVND